jgi:hypothetical protein
MIENGMQRKIFGSKRNDVTGDWRRLHNGELYGRTHNNGIHILSPP